MKKLDLKTFGELEEKVKMGRSILNKLNKLQDNIDKLPSVKNVYFYDQNGYEVINTNYYDSTEDMTQAYFDIATRKIKQLEREFKYLWGEED